MGIEGPHVRKGVAMELNRHWLGGFGAHGPTVDAADRHQRVETVVTETRGD